MAQAVNNTTTDHVWPLSLITNADAQQFACIACNEIPLPCMNDENGDVYCTPCSQQLNNIVPNPAVQKMIHNLQTRCLSVAQDPNQPQNDYLDEGAEGNNIEITNYNNVEQCDWIGSVQEYEKHSEKCPFVVIECECKSFKTKRKFMEMHRDECPRVSVDCPLSCGWMIFRKDIENHLQNMCRKQMVYCPNDDCKMQMERKDLKHHVDDECESRNVECPFKKYGCTVINIKGSGLQQHEDVYKYEHLQYKYNHDTTMLQVEIARLETHREMDNATITRLQQENLQIKSQLYRLQNQANDDDSDDSLGSFVVK